MLSGHFSVPNDYLGGECFITNVPNYCQGYFGITPSIVRIPILLLTGNPDKQFVVYSWTLALLSLVIGIAIWVYVLLPQFLHTMPNRVAVISLFVSITFLSSRPMVYEEAIIWGLSLSFLGTALIALTWKKFTWARLALAVIISILALLSRPTIGIAPSVMFFFFWLVLVLSTNKISTASDLPIYSQNSYLKSSVLLASMMGPLVYLLVNELKFGSITPDLSKHANLMYDTFQLAHFQNSGLFNLSTLPTKVKESIAFPGLHFGSDFPWLSIRSRVIRPIWPATSTSNDVYPFGEFSSLWVFATPILLIAGFILIRNLAWKTFTNLPPSPKFELHVKWATLASFLVPMILIFSFPGFTARYVYDVIPFLFVAILFFGTSYSQTNNFFRRTTICVLIFLSLMFQILCVGLVSREFGCTAGGEKIPAAESCLIW
jgi:hypothetical protein